jgi:hypothetical protein
MIAALGFSQADLTLVAGMISVVGGAFIWFQSTLRRKRIEDDAFQRELIRRDDKAEIERLRTQLTDVRHQAWQLQNDLNRSRPTPGPAPTP